jgi:integrase
MDYNPRKIGREEIDYLRKEVFITSNEYAEIMVKRLLMFCRWSGNTKIAKLKLGFGQSHAKRARWLEDDQAIAMRECAITPTEKLLVHCELDLGMRKCEVRRLTTKSFAKGRMDTVLIHGKGRNGGKYRTIDWHPDSEAVLEEYAAYREGLISKAKAKDATVKVPDRLLIYERGGKLNPYGETVIDNLISAVGTRAGIVRVSNHDLRRTCGRMMYRAAVPLEIIAKIFGHSDTKTTIRYLGLDFDDMHLAMGQYAQYQKEVLLPKVVKNRTEPVRECGGTGI